MDNLIKFIIILILTSLCYAVLTIIIEKNSLLLMSVPIPTQVQVPVNNGST